jgi:hypothetical protein
MSAPFSYGDVIVFFMIYGWLTGASASTEI